MPERPPLPGFVGPAGQAVRRRWAGLPLRVRYLLPLSLAILAAVLVLAWLSVAAARDALRQSLKANLALEVETLRQMLQREHALQQEKVATGVRLARFLLDQSPPQPSGRVERRTVIDQHTHETHVTPVEEWRVGGERVPGGTRFVDTAQELAGITVTLFQRIELGYLRVATTVRDKDGVRAMDTYIPANSPVAQTIDQGRPYIGRAYVVDDWYTTAYEPLFRNGQVVGMLYAGAPEKDLAELRRSFHRLRIGRRGYPFVTDSHGRLLIHPVAEGEDRSGQPEVQAMITQRRGLLGLPDAAGQTRLLAFDTFEPFGFHVGAVVFEEDETAPLIRNIIRQSAWTALAVVILLSALISATAIEDLHRSSRRLATSTAELAAARDALGRSERLAAMGQMAAGIAHEVNNPMGVILMYSNMVLEETPPDSPLRADLTQIAEQAARCRRILSGLLDFARASRVVPRPTDMSELAQRAVKGVVLPEGVRVELVTPIADPVAEVDPDPIVQVLVNLIKNAADALAGPGLIRLTLSGDPAQVILTVADNGPGIPPDLIGRVCEPFFTTKAPGVGTGLGLAVSYGQVKLHRGRLDIDSNTDPTKGPTGTRVTVTLPRQAVAND